MQNHLPLVSVVVAAYNVESYIDRCINSLVKQTYQNLEILLIDDGSTDNSGKICDRYAGKDSRIRVIHKKNGGLSDVRNVGLSQAAGIYLMYVDGDDYVSPNFVDAAVSCAEKHDADVVFFDFEEIEEDTGRRDRWSMKIPGDTVLNTRQLPKILTVTPCAWNKLYRLEFFRSTGLQYPLRRNYEDLTMSPRLLVNADRIVYLRSEPLYYYALREGSIMRSKNFEKSYCDRRAAIEDILSYFKSRGLYETFRQELEYLAFEHSFFVPIKEIVLSDPKSPYLKKFGEYVPGLFPGAEKNCYVKECLSKKDRIMLKLIMWRMYGCMIFLSRVRRQKDMIFKKQNLHDGGR